MKVVLDDSPVKPWRPESKVPRALLEAAFMVLLPRLREGLRFKYVKTFQDDPRYWPARRSVVGQAKPVVIDAHSQMTEPVAMLAGRIALEIEKIARDLNALAGEGEEILTCDLPKPEGTVAFSEIMECKGISLRVVQAYDIQVDDFPMRFDVLCAVVPAAAPLPEPTHTTDAP